MSEEHTHPSDDSTKGLLRQAPKPMEPKYGRSMAPDPSTARFEYDSPEHDTPLPPSRHPSRHQVMRWDPQQNDYAWDDERRTYGRPSYDYPRSMPPPPPPPEWFDHYSYNPPYRRRGSSIRAPPPSVSGPMGPPRRSRRPPQWDDPWEGDEYSDRETVRRSRASAGGGGGNGSPPPGSHMEGLPFLWWMNSEFGNASF
jgi:hypothetical protein